MKHLIELALELLGLEKHKDIVKDWDKLSPIEKIERIAEGKDKH